MSPFERLMCGEAIRPIQLTRAELEELCLDLATALEAAINLYPIRNHLPTTDTGELN